MRTTTVRFSPADIRKLSIELVRNARDLHPGIHLQNLTDMVLDLADPDYISALDTILRREHFAKIARLISRQEAQQKRERLSQNWLFPEIRERIMALPIRVNVGNQIKNREELMYEDLERRVLLLSKKSRAGFKADPEVVALRALMDLWPPRTRKNQGLTLSELDTTKAREAGLIE